MLEAIMKRLFLLPLFQVLLVLLALLVCASRSAQGADESAILPLPKSRPPQPAAIATQTNGNHGKKAIGSYEILPMPKERPPDDKPANTLVSDPDLLLPLPPDKARDRVANSSPTGNIPAAEQPAQISPEVQVTSPSVELALPGEVVINTQNPGPLLPVQQSESVTSTTSASQATNLPIFPKDTSSALFMVMKTWECEKYDGKTLLNHAIGVYGQEAEDQFKAQGLEALPDFLVTLKEDDITLDELLDIVAQKSNTDWGVDISQKTIYFYPTQRQ